MPSLPFVVEVLQIEGDHQFQVASFRGVRDSWIDLVQIVVAAVVVVVDHWSLVALDCFAVVAMIDFADSIVVGFAAEDGN